MNTSALSLKRLLDKLNINIWTCDNKARVVASLCYFPDHLSYKGT